MLKDSVHAKEELMRANEEQESNTKKSTIASNNFVVIGNKSASCDAKNVRKKEVKDAKNKNNRAHPHARQVIALEKQLARDRGKMDKYKYITSKTTRRNSEDELNAQHDEINRVKLENDTLERRLEKEKWSSQQIEQRLGEHTPRCAADAD
ncbi:hypothetical protein PsorP6_002064 [Peronosclerospora sorghi]|uniref:Uncharacterized protein n=1 Tax=Peronosclerospora sorghi TaxID=230839 RepID=A0ACC0WSW0_9STRA|nr:hypothetical protein PsorP6_002064 [Peronosclerospora sorghi]